MQFKSYIFLGSYLNDINPMFGYYVKTYGINIAVKVLKGLDSRDPKYGV